MAIDLKLPLNKLISEIGKSNVAELIRKAYTEGLTLGLAGAHDKVVYRAVVDFIVPEHAESRRNEHGDSPTNLCSKEGN